MQELLRDIQEVGLAPVTKEAEEGAEEPDIEADGAGLVPDADMLSRALRRPALVRSFEKLEDGGIYTVPANSKDLIKQIRVEFGLQVGS